MASSIIILSSANSNENVNITNKSPKNSIINSTSQTSLPEPKTQLTKLNNRNGSRTSSASTTLSNSIFPNLTPEATHITTQSQLNSFNRPVTTGQIVNILTRKTSDLEKKISNQEFNRFTPPMSLSDPSFASKNAGQSVENYKNFVSTQALTISPTDLNNGHKIRIKQNSDNFTVANLTVTNLNHFDNLNRIDTKKDNSETTNSPISTMTSSSSSSPNESCSPILKKRATESNSIEENLDEKKEDNEHKRAKSPQTINSCSTISQTLESSTKQNSLLSASSNNKTKKKVSFNDNLLQVHLIPNLTNFLNVERCKAFEKQDLMSKIDENTGGLLEDEPNSPNLHNHYEFSDDSNLIMSDSQDFNSIQKPKFTKSHLKQIDSDQTITNDLKRNIRNHHFNSNNHLQVVKLTVHSAKFQNDSKNSQSNFLTLVGSNNFQQKPTQLYSKRENSGSTNRSYHSQLFTQQRSNTFHTIEPETGVDSIDDSKTSTSVINFAQSNKPPPPKYVPTASRSYKFMKNENSKSCPQTPNNSADQSGSIEKQKVKVFDGSKENEIVLNSVKSYQKNPKYVFLKQDENNSKEPSFIKSQSTEKSSPVNFNNNSASSFTSDSNSNIYKTGFEIKNLSNNSNKNMGLNSVNQLIALRDVNYYLTNNVKTNLKTLKSPNPNYQPSSNEIAKIRLKTNGHLSNISNLDHEFRRTHSALPLLRNNTSINLAKLNNQQNLDSTKLTNNVSYKIVNSPVSNTLTRAKSFLYNQNLSSTNSIQKRVRGNSIEKTSF